MNQPYEVPLCSLKPGDRFRMYFWEIDSDKFLAGTLLDLSECSAHVLLDAKTEARTDFDKDGELKQIEFRAPAKSDYWAPETRVTPDEKPLDAQPELHAESAPGVTEPEPPPNLEATQQTLF
jgi:hypothetical protein